MAARIIEIPRSVKSLYSPMSLYSPTRWRLLLPGKKGTRISSEIWEKSFYDRRVRGWEEYAAFRLYIHENPVKRGLAQVPGKYPYSSARTGSTLDAVPQWLKPSELSV